LVSKKKLIIKAENFQMTNQELIESIFPDRPLDSQQAEAVENDADVCLLIAGAGTGKSTTVAGKVNYLTNHKEVKPDRILVMSFSKNSVADLEEKIYPQKATMKNPVPAGVHITTIHALAFGICGKPPEDPVSLENRPLEILTDFICDTLFADNIKLKQALSVFGGYFKLNEYLGETNSRPDLTVNAWFDEKVKSEYKTESNIRDTIKYRTYGLVNEKRTIRGEYVSSEQEAKTANFLFLNNIDYEYEPQTGERLGDSNKSYTPDFLIKQGDNQIYMEHFGTTKKGGKNDSMSKEALDKYNKNRSYKISYWNDSNKEFIYTWSNYGKQGMDHITDLKYRLTQRGFKLVKRSDDDFEVYKALRAYDRRRYCNSFAYLLNKFIGQYKLIYPDTSGFDNFIKNADEKTKTKLTILKDAYLYHENTLRQMRKVDFTDLINNATKILERGEIPDKYEWIIVDEFQDTSENRFKFIKTLKEKSGAQLFVVGDDWQSIYRFAGSKVSLFTRFLEYMNCDKKPIYIEKTYRNSQELIDIAGRFITENPEQSNNSLKSGKSLKNPVRIITYEKERGRQNQAKAKENLVKATADIIKDIVKNFGITAENADKHRILITARYNYDLRCIENTTTTYFTAKNNEVYCTEYPFVKLDFCTVHASKGLTYENVIVLDVDDDGLYGFPNKRKDDEIMSYVFEGDTGVIYAEERRLFYVALTRTENYVYLIVPRNYKSEFIEEISSVNNIPIE
jgi:DNA helicase-4